MDKCPADKQLLYDFYCCYSFCKELKANENTALLGPYVDHMAQGLVTMATQSTDEVLSYTLESLIMLLKVHIIWGYCIILHIV